MGQIIASTSNSYRPGWWALSRLPAVMTALLILSICPPASGAITTTGEVSPDPTTSTWSDTLYIGDESDGSMTVDAGSIGESHDTFIGYDRGVAGSLVVTGAGSQWDHGYWLLIGQFGSGSMEVRQGGYAVSFFAEMAIGPSSVAAVTISGAGSQWYNSMDLVLGRMGKASLTIEQGAVMDNSGCTMGASLGAEGTVIVRGAGSEWAAGGMTVGYAGKGSVTIDQGAIASSYRTVIASARSAEGSIVVSGLGSELTNSYLTVGRNGQGSLTITDGATVSGLRTIGFGPTGQGVVTVSGAGSSLATSSLTVGYAGPGSLTIDDGATVTGSYTGTIGHVPGGTGAVTVTGVGSSLSLQYLELAYLGAGSLEISNGATVETEYDIDAGMYAGSTADLEFGLGAAGAGRLIVGRNLDLTGGGTTDLIVTAEPGFAFAHGQVFDLIDWGDEFLGEFDSVTLPNLDNGWMWDTSGLYIDGTLEVVPEPASMVLLAIGGTASLVRRRKGRRGQSLPMLTLALGGSLLLSVAGPAGAAVNVTGDVHPVPSVTPETLYVGDTADGTLTIDQGSEVEYLGAYVGYQSTGSGAITVTGEGSMFSGGRQYVGYYGSGELTIEDGGYLVTATSVNLGYHFGSSGQITVRGEGSQWMLPSNPDYISQASMGRITLAYRGDGSLVIEEGGVVHAGLCISGYYDDESEVHVSVTGVGSQLMLNDGLWLDGKSDGSVLVAGGATVQVNDARMGTSVLSGDFEATITGAGTQFVVAEDWRVGFDGYARVVIEDNAFVQTDALRIGNDNDIDARPSELLVDGATVDCIGGLYVGIEGGSSKIDIVNGGFVMSEDGCLGYIGTGDLTVTGPGSWWVNGKDMDLGHSNSGLLSLHDGGMASTYTLYFREGGALDIGLSGTAVESHLNVDYRATLNGELSISLLNGFAPTPGDEFRVIDAGGWLEREFAAVSFPNAQEWAIEYDYLADDVIVSFLGWNAGNFDEDTDIDAIDIDLLADAIRLGSTDFSLFDISADGVSGGADGVIDTNDLDYLVHQLVETTVGVGSEYGDFNLDGLIDTTDLTRLATNFGPGTTWAEGNANRYIDLTIDTTDLTILGTYFGFDATTDAIPEPATMSPLALGACLPLFRRKRR